MSHQVDHRNPDHTPGGPDARAKKPWRTPRVISSSATKGAEKHSFETFEGGSYPTTHGPS
jgi:hypothetical protein